MTATLIYLIYGVFALGAVGVYLLMPVPGRATRTGGAIIAIAALAGMLALCAHRLMTPSGVNVLFYIAAAVALFSAVKMITHDRPVYSALYFVMVILAVTPLLLLQAAEFLAVALVIIYAGAILVTYVFVIMLSQQSDQPIYDRRAREPLLAVFAGFVTMAVVAGQIGALPKPLEESEPLMASQAAEFGNTAEVGAVMMSDYLVAFELAGILLLIAMIGAIAVSRKQVPTDETIPAAPPPGKIGREVPPF